MKKFLVLSVMLLSTGCVYYPYGDYSYYPDSAYSTSYYPYSGYYSSYPYGYVTPSLNLNFSYPYYRNYYPHYNYPNYYGYGSRYSPAWQGRGSAWQGHGNVWHGYGGGSRQGHGGGGRH